MSAPLDDCVTIADVRRKARRRLPRMVFDYIDGGAEDEATLRRNSQAFGAITFRPKILVDVAKRDLSTVVLGEPIALPVMLAPTGLTRLAWRGGECDVARGAARSGTLFSLSTASSNSMEDVAAAASGPLWFQLYLWRDRDLVSSFIERAAKAGYKALCLTADVPVVGQRERDLRNGMTIPPRIRASNVINAATRLRWSRDFVLGSSVTFGNLVGAAGVGGDDAVSLGTFAAKMMDASATWEGLTWLREEWRGPLVLKGVMSGEDARRAVDFGADAVVISNHGGRQLDGLPATIEVLPEVAAAVGGSAEVYLDGGVRRGTDVVKALALGARAVFVGRPYLYGLAVAGADGVERVVDIFRAEIDRALALLGAASIADVDPDVARLPGWANAHS